MNSLRISVIGISVDSQANRFAKANRNTGITFTGESVHEKGNFFSSLCVAFLFNAAIGLLKDLAQFQRCSLLWKGRNWNTVSHPK
jgi:hypothetical protein